MPLYGALLLEPRLIELGRSDPAHGVSFYLLISWPHSRRYRTAAELISGWTFSFEMFFCLLFAVGLLLSEAGKVDHSSSGDDAEDRGKQPRLGPGKILASRRSVPQPAAAIQAFSRLAANSAFSRDEQTADRGERQS